MRLSRKAWAWLALAATTVGLAFGLAKPLRALADPAEHRPRAVWPGAAPQTFALPTTTATPTPTSTAVPTTTPAPVETTTEAPRPTSRAPKPAPKPPIVPAVVAPVVGDLGARVVADARRYLGVPYLWGGVTSAGMDCSGLVYRVLADLGISAPRTADAQMRWTTRISAAQARPGDLVFGVYASGWAHHVGIVVGPDLMIDAPDVGLTVGVHHFYADSTAFGRIP